MIILGQVSYLSILIGVRFNGFQAFSLNPSMNVLRIIFLFAGLGVLGIIISKLYVKYRVNKNLTRLNILLAIASFIIACAAYTFTNFFQSPDNSVNRFFFDLATLFIILASYMFLVFGITFLIVPANERAIHNFKRVMEFILIAMYALFLLVKICNAFNITGGIVDTLSSVGQYFIYLFGIVCIILMLVIAMKALVLSKRTSDAVFKNGLNALGISYLFLFASIVAFLLNTAVFKNDQYVSLIAILLLIAGFYFIYGGFVKPTTTSSYE